MKSKRLHNFLSKLNLKQKFALATGAPLILMMIMVLIFILSIKSFVRTNENVKNAMEIQQLIGKLEANERSYLITGNESFLVGYNAIRNQIPQEIAIAKENIGDKEQQQNLDSISQIINQWHVEAAEPEILARRKINLSQKGRLFNKQDTVKIKTKVEDVIDPKMLREFQRIFTLSTGIANLVVEKDGVPVKYQSLDEFTEYCFGYTRKSTEGTKRCQACDANGGKVSAETGKPYVYDCHASLIDFGVPIILEGQQIGSWLGGQILVKKPDEAKYRAYAREIGITDVEGYIKALRKVPVISRDKIDAAAEMLRLFAETVSGMGNDKLAWQQLIDRIQKGKSKELLDAAKTQIATFVETEKNNNAFKEKITIAISIFGCVLAILLAIVIALFVINGLYSQLGGDPMLIANIARKISSGYIEADPNAKTSVGVFADMQAMIAKLREVVQNIRESSKGLIATSQDMSATAGKVAEGASQLAASTEEVSASMEQMASNINQNSENTKLTERLVKKVVADIQNGNESVNNTVISIKKIAEKISVIEQIAHKTDLLAMNASVEAARAGEYGKGFAVVASEIRRLADVTRKMALEISSLSTESVVTAEKSCDLLSGNVTDIQTVSQLIQEITVSSIEQNTGVDHVNQAIQQLVQVTQQYSAVADTMTNKSNDLSQEARHLFEIVSFFHLNNSDKVQLILELTKQSEYLQHTIQQLMQDGIEINIPQESEEVSTNKKTKNSPHEKPHTPINLDMTTAFDKDFETM